jgi:hypothetical protein
MTASKRQFGLLPEGTQEIGSALHGSEAPAREIADHGNAGGAEVRDFAALEVILDLLDRVELGRVGRQELDLHRVAPREARGSPAAGPRAQRVSLGWA